jgi:hypothetical protein
VDEAPQLLIALNGPHRGVLVEDALALGRLLFSRSAWKVLAHHAQVSAGGVTLLRAYRVRRRLLPAQQLMGDAVSLL